MGRNTDKIVEELSDNPGCAYLALMAFIAAGVLIYHVVDRLAPPKAVIEAPKDAKKP